MSKAFFEVFPTFLGIPHVPEIKSIPTKELLGAVDLRQVFVFTYLPIAEKAGKIFGINPVVILAQAAIESGWGTSTLAKQYHNFFGITAYGETNNYWKGGKYISKSSGLPFRTYQTATDGIMDFARLISTKYKEAARASASVTEYARLISSSPYINEKNGDNRAKYKETIIRNAVAIMAFIKKKFQILNN